MASRNQFTAKERAARSRLAQLLHTDALICGSVVSMARRCGKKGCHCAQPKGEKHVSLYLSIKMEDGRRMVYIPPELEQEVRRQVEVYRETQRLTGVVSDACIHRVLEQKRNRADKK